MRSIDTTRKLDASYSTRENSDASAKSLKKAWMIYKEELMFYRDILRHAAFRDRKALADLEMGCEENKKNVSLQGPGGYWIKYMAITWKPELSASEELVPGSRSTIVNIFRKLYEKYQPSNSRLNIPRGHFWSECDRCNLEIERANVIIKADEEERKRVAVEKEMRFQEMKAAEEKKKAEARKAFEEKCSANEKFWAERRLQDLKKKSNRARVNELSSSYRREYEEIREKERIEEKRKREEKKSIFEEECRSREAWWEKRRLTELERRERRKHDSNSWYARCQSRLREEELAKKKLANERRIKEEKDAEKVFYLVHNSKFRCVLSELMETAIHEEAVRKISSKEEEFKHRGTEEEVPALVKEYYAYKDEEEHYARLNARVTIMLQGIDERKTLRNIVGVPLEDDCLENVSMVGVQDRAILLPVVGLKRKVCDDPRLAFLLKYKAIYPGCTYPWWVAIHFRNERWKYRWRLIL